MLQLADLEELAVMVTMLATMWMPMGWLVLALGLVLRIAMLLVLMLHMLWEVLLAMTAVVDFAHSGKGSRVMICGTVVC